MEEKIKYYIKIILVAIIGIIIGFKTSVTTVDALTLNKIDQTRIYTLNYTLLAECIDTTTSTSISNRCATSANGVHFISSNIFTNLRYNSTYNIKFQVAYGGQDVQFADVESFGMYLIDANGRNKGNITCESGGWSNETDSTTQNNYIVHNIDCDFQVNVNNIKGIGFTQTMNSIQGVQFFLETEIQINLLNSDAAIIENQNQNTDKILNEGTFVKPEEDIVIKDGEEKEEEIYDLFDGVDINAITIDFDSTSVTKVFELLNRIITQNTIIQTMIITILSISIIKLVLGR